MRGHSQSAAEYDPFGEPIVALIGTAYGFTGELTDGNGLLYLRARYLAPSLGTFASRDPWRGTVSAPRTWNGYAWVEGNVVNRVDPSGYSVLESRDAECNAPCDQLWSRLNSIVAALARRIQEMLDDPCRFYDRDILGSPVAGSEGCGSGDWNGHIEAIKQRQNQLRKYLNCRSNGSPRFDSEIEPSDTNCTNSFVYPMAQAAVAHNPSESVPTRHQDEISLVPEAAQGVPVPLVTPAPPSTQPTIQPQRVPEPPAPFGRGSFEPASEPYPEWTVPLGYVMGIATMTGAACVAAAVTGSASVALASGLAAACASNPSLCTITVK